MHDRARKTSRTPAADSVAGQVRSVLRSHGAPLDETFRARVEAMLGADLGDVELHLDDAAARSAEALRASAYTSQDHIVFGRGAFDPSSSPGQKLLVHELAHVVQQRRGTVDGELIDDGLRVSDPHDRFERAARQVSESPWPTLGSGPLRAGLLSHEMTQQAAAQRAPVVPATVSVQRVESEEEEEEEEEEEDEDEDEARAAAARALAAQALYDQLSGTLGTYAKRKPGAGQFTDNDIRDSMVKKALVTERQADGSLSPAGVALMDQVSVDQARNTTYAKVFTVVDQRVGGTQKERDKALRKAMNDESNRNDVSGKTKFPELANLIGPPTVSQPATKQVTISGTTLTVNYDSADVNSKARLALLTTAVKKVRRKGYAVPALTVTVPRWGRSLQVNADCTIGQQGDSNAAAIYTAPNLIYLSSAGLRNPQQDTEDDLDKPTGDRRRPFEARYKFMSSRLDPSGAATIVHELGHALHYAKSPSNFHLLHSTDFANGGTAIAYKVSGYGAGNPREFVAEVFTGLIYGKKFPPDVMAMYASFGGP